ncbi:metalloendopeptidase-like membrane protein [Desulfosporosinus orientis DSM 765]|uniref:Metalloendopeptidase-like membrane protein n=1 Tax=Desulfosporosinus orientis (strain ATCC 19365 / DSM 765 / NCIMB 8382 / VKM B-1628 / Singapore I) TaxID=768706 RepID=G7W957_DESOD|nr:M23 family metallopeptidase [Desulfosporosinus orientis]AET68698.1 metalloendopeptidase-like membrane protein [Desulfosporosinus orientis DSM 765]
MRKISKRELIHYSFLIILAMILWKVIHLSPKISPDIYPYLNSISPELVRQCVKDKDTLTSVSYEDLLAIRSTVPEKEAQVLIDQLRTNVPFSSLTCGNISKDRFKAVHRHRQILRENPYYYPNRYLFPVHGEIWYEDSYGADREGGKRRHEGTDIFGKEGTPIISSCGGIIEQLGWNRLGGERVGVRGDDGNYYYYAHLQYISPHLVQGNRIEAGEVIGGMGHTGDALTTPDHLHFGIELPNGQWINPYPFLAVWQLWEDEQAS